MAHKLEFPTLKWGVTDQFHEYLYGANFEVYMDNKPTNLHVLISAKLEAVGQHWIALGWIITTFISNCKSRKSNVEADALSRILWSSCGQNCNNF